MSCVNCDSSSGSNSGSVKAAVVKGYCFSILYLPLPLLSFPLMINILVYLSICYNVSMQTAVVTGGAGFIGSHLCDALLARGYKVICVDNLLTGRAENLEVAKKSANFQFVNQDVIRGLPEMGKIDFIYHLASPASVVDYQKYPKETALVNSLGTMNVLDTARKLGARVLFASTSEIYGDPKEHPQKESYWGNVNPNGLRACYDEAKRFGEMMCMLYFREHKLDTRVVRIFNTYGPRMRPTDGRVVSNFINQALKGDALTIYGEGNQTRSYCFVSDLVEGLLKIMNAPGKAGEVYNLGNPGEFTVQELAEMVRDLINPKLGFIYKELPGDDPTRRRPDIEKIKRDLGWEPKVSLEEGLKMMIKSFDSSSR